MTSQSVQSFEESESAVSWPAVVAGSVAALAMSVALTAVAAGLGFAFAPTAAVTAAAAGEFTPLLGSAMIVVQVLSAALGGYLAGRLRTKWTAIHDHEVHFRDTAHGLLVWALSTVIGLVLLVGSMSPPPPLDLQGSPVAGAASQGAVAFGDRQASATPEERVRLEARAAERAKNIAAQASLFTGIGLLLSAFVACVSAAIGGLRRDEMHKAYHSQTA
jgi:MFS family permease